MTPFAAKTSRQTSAV